MIRDIDVTHGDELRIGCYVGLMVSPTLCALVEYYIQGS